MPSLDVREKYAKNFGKKYVILYYGEWNYGFHASKDLSAFDAPENESLKISKMKKPPKGFEMSITEAEADLKLKPTLRRAFSFTSHKKKSVGSPAVTGKNASPVAAKAAQRKVTASAVPVDDSVEVEDSLDFLDSVGEGKSNRPLDRMEEEEEEEEEEDEAAEEPLRDSDEEYDGSARRKGKKLGGGLLKKAKRERNEGKEGKRERKEAKQGKKEKESDSTRKRKPDGDGKSQVKKPKTAIVSQPQQPVESRPDKIKRYVDSLRSATTDGSINVDEAKSCMSKLYKLKMSRDELRDSKAAPFVSDLRKHSNETIAQIAGNLRKKWIEECQQPAAAVPPSSSSSSSSSLSASSSSSSSSAQSSSSASLSSNSSSLPPSRLTIAAPPAPVPSIIKAPAPLIAIPKPGAHPPIPPKPLPPPPPPPPPEEKTAASTTGSKSVALLAPLAAARMLVPLPSDEWSKGRRIFAFVSFPAH